MYTKYKTLYTVYTQDNQLNKNALQYSSRLVLQGWEIYEIF